MTLYSLMRNWGFDPIDIERMSLAYEFTLLRIGLVDRNDPITEIIAKSIIEIAQTGEKDPEAICATVLKTIGLPANDDDRPVTRA